MAKHSTGVIPNETVVLFSAEGPVLLNSDGHKVTLSTKSGFDYTCYSDHSAFNLMKVYGMEHGIPWVKHRAMSKARHLATHGEFTEQFCYGDFHFVKIDSAVGYDESYFIDGMGSEYDRLVRLSDVAEEFEYGLEEYHPSQGRRRVAPWGTEGK